MVMVVPAAKRMRVVLGGALPWPMSLTVSDTVMGAPGLALVGVAEMFDTSKSGSCCTAVTVNGVVSWLL